MSTSDDPQDVLHRFVSDDDANRLFAGSDDVDAGLVPVADLFASLRSSASADELAGATALLARMADVVDTAPGVIAASTPRRTPVFARLVSGKVAAIAAITLFSAGAAAAATGSLPDPVQRSVSTTFSHVGIDFPTPQDRPPAFADASVDDRAHTSTTVDTSAPTTSAATSSTVAGSSSPSSTEAGEDEGDDVGDDHGQGNEPGDDHGGVGPNATGSAAHGLCTAFLAGGSNGNRLDSTAMRNLTAAATSRSQTVEQYCADVLADDNSGPGNNEGTGQDNREDNSGPGNGTGNESGDDHGGNGDDDDDAVTSTSTATSTPSGTTPSSSVPGDDHGGNSGSGSGGGSGDDHSGSGSGGGGEDHSGNGGGDD